MDIGIPVEVAGIHGEFYPGIVFGLNSLDEYKVKLLDSSHSSSVGEVCLSPCSMRLPPEITNFPFDPIQGQEVDVLIPFKSAENLSEHDSSAIDKLSAWWPGKVKKVGGSFVIVELNFDPDLVSNSDSSSNTIKVQNGRVVVPLPSSVEKTDIVEKHQLRPRSHQVNFTAASFHKHGIDIPDELEKYCRDPSNFQHFARRCGLPVLVCMAPESLKPAAPIRSENGDTFNLRARLLVISPDPAPVKRAAVIDNTFIDMLRQKVLILQQTEELSRKLEASRVSQTSPAFVDDLHVPEEMIPYAIGFQESNIRRANNIPGIISIKFNRAACIFRISGKTEDAVKQAKAMLDYATETILVPRCYVGPIVGSGQRHIQHIVDCLELSGLKIHDPTDPETEHFAAFRLTGTRQAINDARMFLEFHVASLQDLDRLRGISSPPSIPSQCESKLETGPESCGDSIPTQSKQRGGRSQRVQPNFKSSFNGTGPSGPAQEHHDSLESIPSSNIHHSNGLHNYKHVEHTGDHARFHQKQRPRRPQNLQTNNSAANRQAQGVDAVNQKSTDAKTMNLEPGCNGYEPALVNGCADPHCGQTR